MSCPFPQNLSSPGCRGGGYMLKSTNNNWFVVVQLTSGSTSPLAQVEG